MCYHRYTGKCGAQNVKIIIVAGAEALNVLSAESWCGSLKSVCDYCGYPGERDSYNYGLAICLVCKGQKKKPCIHGFVVEHGFCEHGYTTEH